MMMTRKIKPPIDPPMIRFVEFFFGAADWVYSAPPRSIRVDRPVAGRSLHFGKEPLSTLPSLRRWASY